jgi:RHS repeat-associated protein
VLRADGTRFEDQASAPGYTIHRYRPRIEGLFARIERWTNQTTGAIHWRSITRDNVATSYGLTSASQIADGNGTPRVFSWLICESRDDKGNAITYEYAAENRENVDLAEVNEKNRTRTANRYLKWIRYGNRVSHLIQPDLSSAEWMFEVLFDYDEGHYAEINPAAGPEAHRLVWATVSRARPWTRRPDPFSSHRAGFEVRTYRRCRRVLMFHCFAELGSDPCLVSATEFSYDDLDYTRPVTVEQELAHAGSTRIASFIRAIAQSGFVRHENQIPDDVGGVPYVTYRKKSLPALEFQYSKAVIHDDIRDVEDSLENLPIGIDGRTYQWVDLDGEGVTGILTEQADAWYYKPNLGGGHFGPLQTVAARPSLAALNRGGQQLLDLSGDGQLDLVALATPLPGFSERTHDEDWEPFAPFAHLPNLDWDDPNLRFVDLDGDGHADILITNDDVFRWYPSLAEDGFGRAAYVRTMRNEEQGPRLVLADGTQSIYLADMCGDGLTDLVRVRHGEVCYWPNQGYGRFGAKVTMDNAPWLDHPDRFSQKRVRLADIDGSGVTDIIYLGADGVHLYFNQSGNRWSDARDLMQFPASDDMASVMTADLFGNGTACLVWSSALPADARRPMRYIDLMGGNKPHLLTKSVNNLGAETSVEYVAATTFYLADKRAGTPWITKVPFPVHVVERVSTWDRISGNLFVSRYEYHHGYFDGVEREFRGFGRVDQFDTEDIAALNAGQRPVATNVGESSHVPAVLIRTWFHTGICLGRDRVSNFFAGLLDQQDASEYYREAGATDHEAQQLLLDDTVLPADWTEEEIREGCRALKGLILRQEVYARDRTPKAPHPYVVTEQNFTIRRLQPQGPNRHAVFFSHARESLNYHYERSAVTPRVTHALTLDVDECGNVRKTAAVAYGRRVPDANLQAQDRVRQAATHITYTEHDFTNAVAEPNEYRTPLPCETRTYEVTGLRLAADRNRFMFAEVLEAGSAAAPIRYEETAAEEVLQKRFIEHTRTIYRRNNLAGPLPLGQLQSLALAYESYSLTFTVGLIAEVYGGRTVDPIFSTNGGYVHSEGDASWWTPSGRMFLSPGPADTFPQELAYAREHFFLPHRYRDPFHTDDISTETVVGYDSYDLLLRDTRDPVGNRVAADQDYRVLQPTRVTDPNGNRVDALFDALGMLVATAVKGKPLPAPVEGDSLDGLQADLTDEVMLDHIHQRADPRDILREASTRIVYDLFAYVRTKDRPEPEPAVVYMIARETHASEPEPDGGLKVQRSFSYSDGFGREIQQKTQAEVGAWPLRGADGKIVVDVNGEPLTDEGVDPPLPRWVGSGWIVFNNKGNPVRQYEPFFTERHQYEFDVRIGVSSVLFYDPFERVVATLNPDHTWEKVSFDPWRQKTWDASDTVLIADPKSDADAGRFFERLPDAEYLPSWYDQRQAAGEPAQTAASKAAVHANTPTIAHMDALGRTFLTVAHNAYQYSNMPVGDPRVEEFHATRVVFDIEGNQRQIIDALDRTVMRYDYDMLGNRIHQASMEAGERWTLNDVAGKTIYTWDSREHVHRTVFDPLRRPVESYLTEANGPPQQVGRIVYGEGVDGAETNNLRGKVVELFDQAGIVRTGRYDFKGNLLRSERELARDYKSTLDWTFGVPLDAALPYMSQTAYDALNRPATLTSPDDSVVRLRYNDAGLLDAVDANLRGVQQNDERVWTPFVKNIDYNAKGQRTRIEYGSGGTAERVGVTTTYAYDRLTFRLAHLHTRRNVDVFPDDDPHPAEIEWPGSDVQNLYYTYDAVGNIAHIRDDAQQRIYFRNRRVDPAASYTYDATKRLIEATGREHLGQVGARPTAPDAANAFHSRLDHPGDGRVVDGYIERYVYDFVANLVRMEHPDEVQGWVRTYAYNEASQLEPTKVSNRVSSTTVGGVTETYRYEGSAGLHGNITSMTPLPTMRWDSRDQLQATSREVNNGGTPELTWYVYDATGQRVRKVTDRSGSSGPPTRRRERIYLGAFEIFREYGVDGESVTLERETLHVMDDEQRIALVETRTEGDDGSPERLTRYQFGNHLGSASLELDDEAQIISYEEYFPYGSTSYQAVRRDLESSTKRYRYTAMERDEESGLSYHQARYYAPWFAAWISCDPAGTLSGLQRYVYARDNPTRFVDKNGRDPTLAGPDTTNLATTMAVAAGLETGVGVSSAGPSAAIIANSTLPLTAPAVPATVGAGSALTGGAGTTGAAAVGSSIAATIAGVVLPVLLIAVAAAVGIHFRQFIKQVRPHQALDPRRMPSPSMTPSRAERARVVREAPPARRPSGVAQAPPAGRVDSPIEAPPVASPIARIEAPSSSSSEAPRDAPPVANPLVSLEASESVRRTPRHMRWTHYLSQAIKGEGIATYLDDIIVMPRASRGQPSNKAGYLRSSSHYFRALLKQHPEYFSRENRAAIARGEAPVVDEEWIGEHGRYHEGHRGFMGQTLHHHHLAGGPRAVAVPLGAHTGAGWTRVMH